MTGSDKYNNDTLCRIRSFINKLYQENVADKNKSKQLSADYLGVRIYYYTLNCGLVVPNREDEVAETLGFLLTKDVITNILKITIKSKLNRITERNKYIKQMVMLAKLHEIAESLFKVEISKLETGIYQGTEVFCECGAKTALVDNSIVYLGKCSGKIYQCPECGNYVGVHEGTDIPLGTPADKELQKYRQFVHFFFEKIIQEKGWTRNEAYNWLSVKLRIPKDSTHIGMFDLPTCKRALAIISKEK